MISVTPQPHCLPNPPILSSVSLQQLYNYSLSGLPKREPKMPRTSTCTSRNHNHPVPLSKPANNLIIIHILDLEALPMGKLHLLHLSQLLRATGKVLPELYLCSWRGFSPAWSPTQVPFLKNRGLGPVTVLKHRLVCCLEKLSSETFHSPDRYATCRHYTISWYWHQEQTSIDFKSRHDQV